MKNFIPFFLILILLISACGEEGGETPSNTDAESITDSTAVVEDSPEASSPILGTWELVEKRIPDLGPIPLGNIFFTFGTDGKVESKHEDDSGLGAEKSDYTFEENQLFFNETQYEIVSLLGDTLRLKSNTDGITAQSIFVKRE